MKCIMSLFALLMCLASVSATPDNEGVPPPDDCRCVTSVPLLGYCRADGTCICRLDDGDCQCKWPGDDGNGKGWWTCVAGSGCCGPNTPSTRRRDLVEDDESPQWPSSEFFRLHSSGRDEEVGAEYRKLVGTCGDFEYLVSIHVDSHLHAVAAPGEEAVAAECPFAMAQTRFPELSKPGVKELLIWYDEDVGGSKFKPEHSFPIGTFKLSKLATAYEEADPNSSAGSTGYNVITNNCGSFMINLASALGVKINHEVSTFVARRLVQESGSELVARIHDIMSNFPMFSYPSQMRTKSGSDDRHLRYGESYDADATDMELVERLVEAHASNLS